MGTFEEKLKNFKLNNDKIKRMLFLSYNSNPQILAFNSPIPKEINDLYDKMIEENKRELESMKYKLASNLNTKFNFRPRTSAMSSSMMTSHRKSSKNQLNMNMKKNETKKNLGLNLQSSSNV